MNVGLTMYATLQLIPHTAEDSETGSMHSDTVNTQKALKTTMRNMYFESTGYSPIKTGTAQNYLGRNQISQLNCNSTLLKSSYQWLIKYEAYKAHNHKHLFYLKILSLKAFFKKVRNTHIPQREFQ